MAKFFRDLKNRVKKLPYMIQLYEWMVIKLRTPRVKLTVKTHYSYGTENADKKFYLIRCNNIHNGLFSTVFYILPYIRYALKKHYIPVIDLKNTYLPLLQDGDKKGYENAWEYYYEQPIEGYSLDDVFQSKQVIYMTEDRERIVPYVHWDSMFPTSNKQLHYWHTIINCYLRLNKTLESKINDCMNNIFPHNARIMGVSIRAGFYAGMLLEDSLFKGHPKATNCEEYIEITEAKMKEWNCSYIFLAVDDREYLEKFKDYFKDRCLYVERELIHYFENDVPVTDPRRRLMEFEDVSIYKRNEDYIIETYLLAKCTSLYSCISGQGKLAYFVNGGRYAKLQVYDEGIII